MIFSLKDVHSPQCRSGLSLSPPFLRFTPVSRVTYSLWILRVWPSYSVQSSLTPLVPEGDDDARDGGANRTHVSWWVAGEEKKNQSENAVDVI